MFSILRNQRLDGGVLLAVWAFVDPFWNVVIPLDHILDVQKVKSW